jgi:hypothetical protein
MLDESGIKPENLDPTPEDLGTALVVLGYPREGLDRVVVADAQRQPGVLRVHDRFAEHSQRREGLVWSCSCGKIGTCRWSRPVRHGC